MSNTENPSVTFEAKVLDEGQRADLTFTVGGKSAWMLAVRADDVDNLISKFSSLRCELFPAIPSDLKPNEIYNIDAFDPKWRINPNTENRYAVLWIRHPGLGWRLFGFPRHEAAKISHWLRKIPVYATEEERRNAFPQEASSFGNDKFLLTSHGLGFYYFGEGESRIGLNPFDQVEFDSDRAAGIVAGSIVERRLEGAIKSILRKDEKEMLRKVSDALFRVSGPLGSFRAKIDLAFALNVLSATAYRDISTIKGIRNDFAHQLELDSFDIPTIRDRCKTFTFVDLHVGPVPPFPKDDIEPSIDCPNPYLGYPDYNEKLSDPRFRYVMTSQLFSHQLGFGADSKTPKLPML